MPQDHGVDTHRGRAILHGRPKLSRDVEIGYALVVAMQVENDVMADRQFDQQALQAHVHRGSRRLWRQGALVGAVEQGKVAVEIGARAEVEAALEIAV